MQPEDFGVPSVGPVAPTQMALRINQSLAALLSLNSGDDPPEYAVKGTLHLDTSTTPHVLRIKGDEVWAPIGTLDAEAGLFAFDMSLGISDISGLQTALDGKVPTARQILVAGLLSGGGALSGNVTLTVTKASQAQAEAGTADDVVMTPLAVAQAIAALALANGAVGTTKLADGAVTNPKLGAGAVTAGKMAAGAAVQDGTNATSGGGQVFLGRSGDNLRFRRIVVQKSTSGSGNGVSDVGISIGTSGNDITITLSVTKTTFSTPGGGGGG